MFWRVILRLGRFGQTTIGLCCFFILLVYTVIHTRWFQDWAIKKTTTYLSKELNTNVKIDKITFDLFSKLDLEGFYVADLKGDTLLYAESFKVDYGLTLKTLYGQGFAIDGLLLENAKVYLKRKVGEKNSNLQFVLDYLKGEEKPKTDAPQGTPFDLKLKYLSFKKIKFVNDDEVTGNFTSASLDDGSISFEKLDIPNNQILIKAIEIIQPTIVVQEKERFPSSEVEKEEKKEITHTDTKKDTSKPKPLIVQLKKFNLTDGSFAYDNFRVSPAKKYADIVDFNHLNIKDLTFQLDDLDLQKDDLKARLKQIAFKETSGFEIISLNVKNIHANSRRLELNDFQLLTPNSNIGDTIILKYISLEDFDDFANKVLLETNFKDARLALKDLMPFDHGIATNAFFQQNADDVFSINGKIMGKINSLKSSSLAINTKGISFKGKFSTKNLTIPDQELLNFNIDRLVTDINTIQLLFPDIEIPNEVKKFNKLDFSGYFDGFTYNFLANGLLKTDLGSLSVKMFLDQTNGKDKATYGGDLDLIDFDLGELIGIDTMPRVSLHTNLSDGKGLTDKTASAKINANIPAITLNGYEYKNLSMNGKLDKTTFDGDFGIKDDNIDFSFKGKVNLKDSIPTFNIKANVKKIALKGLKLIEDDVKIAGLFDIDIKSKDILKGKFDDLQGSAKINNLNFNYKNAYYWIDSLIVRSEVTPFQYRRMSINSELLDADVEGDFKFDRLENSVRNYVHRNHPNIAARFDVAFHPETLPNDYLDVKLKIKNSKNFAQLIDRQLDTLRNINFTGHFNSVTDSLFFDIGAPDVVKYGDLQFNDIAINAKLHEGFGEGFIGIYHTVASGNHLGTVLVPIKFQGDALDMTISADKLTKEISDLNIETDFFIEKDFFQLGLHPSSFNFLSDKWAIDTAKNIRFTSKFLEIPHLLLKNKNREIALSDIDKKGISLLVSGFNFQDLNPLINDDRAILEGDMFVSARVEDIFNVSGISAVVSADTIKWNGRDWGVLRVDANLKDLKNPVNIYTSLTNGNEQLTFEGFYVLPNNNYTSNGVVYPGNSLQASANTSNIPMVWVKTLAGEGVSDVKGTIDAKLKVSGDLSCLELEGQARVRDVSFKIDYLNTTYYIKDEVAKIYDNYIDASGAKIYDELGNSATLYGGLSHQYFNYLRLDLVIDSGNNDILAMNTTKELNNLYYGRGIGKIRMRFAGSFNRTFIIIEKAVTGKGTTLNIPVSYTQEAEAVTFVKFKDKKQVTVRNPNQEVDLDGLGFEMNLQLTEDAEVQIIFDEQAGDIIKGKGVGLIRFDVPISGDFKMLGDYKFSEGKYLFTIRQSLVNVDKPFNIRRGGTLTWTDGDPFAAQMDITADYKGLRTAPYNLIADNLQPNEEISAKQSTNVDLTMHMTGALLKPDIAFDVRFPTLIGNLKSYADSRLNLLTQDPAELNRQVFGLLVLGGFLPSGNLQNANFVGSTVNNTLSGLFSNQASNYINSWLNDVVKSNGVISSINLDINTQLGVLSSSSVVGFNVNEVQVKPRFNFFDNRLSIDAGLVGSTTTGDAKTNISGDFAIEYAITSDRHLLVRAYNRNVQEVDGNRNRTGVGFVWRREFDKLSDLKKKKK